MTSTKADSAEADATSAEAAPLPPTTPAPRDDSAMDADGVDADESVDKPQKRRVVELLPGGVHRRPSTTRRRNLRRVRSRADLRLPAAPKSFGFDLAPYARAAGVDVEAAVAAFFVVLSFWRAMAASVTRRAPGAAESFVGKLVTGCRHRRGDGGDMILAHDPPGFTFGVRAGALPPQQTTLTWTEWLRGFLGMA